MRKFIAAALSAAALCLSLVSTLSAGAFADNAAPIAENFEFETYRGVSYGGELSALDPDGDKLSFEITTKPRKGSVELSDGGHFVYTPDEGEKGRDYFGYRAVDSAGKRSQEATVIIRLVKQSCNVSYSDMENDGRSCAAVFLAECGAYTGEMLAGEYHFNPDAVLTRGEFLSMCMSVTGAELLSGVVSTGFYDDESIPGALKPCISTAVRDGIVTGYSRDGHCVFDASAEISKTEAMVILDRCLKLNDVSYVNLESAIPAWASQSAANLHACGIVGEGIDGSEALTRGDAAEMLYAAAQILGNR